MFATPLALYNLLHDRRRLAVAVAGVTFAVVLMFMQLGFQNALFDSNVAIIKRLNADVFLVNAAQPSLPDQRRIPLDRIITARRCPGVAQTYPLYSERVLSELTVPGDCSVKGYPIRVFGFELDDPVFTSDDSEGDGNWVSEYLGQLKLPQTAIYDAFSKPVYGFPDSEAGDSSGAKSQVHHAELAGKSIDFVGYFHLGVDFSNPGNAIMSAENIKRYFPWRNPGGAPLDAIDMGLVKLEDGADPEQVRQQLQTMLPTDTAVFTKAGLIQRDTHFWSTNTPIGKIFFIGVVIGLIVGVAICYQIIYADISDHLPELATLRAMGYTSWYFVGLVLSMSFYLSVLGFVIGCGFSYGGYRLIHHQTKLLMNMTPHVMTQVYVLTLIMCVASGVFAVRKVLSVDPADLY